MTIPVFNPDQNSIVTEGPLPTEYYPMPENGYDRYARITVQYVTTTPPLSHTPQVDIQYFNITSLSQTALLTSTAIAGDRLQLGAAERLGTNYPFVARSPSVNFGRSRGDTSDIKIWEFYIPVYEDEEVVQETLLCGDAADPFRPVVALHLKVTGNAILGDTYFGLAGQQQTGAAITRVTGGDVEDYKYPDFSVLLPFDSIAVVDIQSTIQEIDLGTGIDGATKSIVLLAQQINNVFADDPKGYDFPVGARQVIGTDLYRRLTRPLNFEPAIELDVLARTLDFGHIQKTDQVEGFIVPAPMTEPQNFDVRSVPDVTVENVDNGTTLFETKILVPAKFGDTVRVINAGGAMRILVLDKLFPNRGEQYILNVGFTPNPEFFGQVANAGAAWPTMISVIDQSLTTYNEPGWPSFLIAEASIFRSSQSVSYDPGQNFTGTTNLGLRAPTNSLPVLGLSDTPISNFVPPDPPEPPVPPALPGGIALDLKKLDYSWYADIRNRGTQSKIPTHIFCDGDYPTREVKLWRVPAENGVVELWLWQPIDTSVDLDAELNLPPGYERALLYKLALELSPEFGKVPPPAVKAVAASAEAALKRLNNLSPPLPARDRRLPNQTGRDGFNWITGRSGPDNWNP